MLILKVYGTKHQRTGTKKDGTEFKVNYQEAEILRQNRRPRPIEITYPMSGAYVEGLYTLDERSFKADDYDRLSLTYLRLVALDDAIRIAQSAEENATGRQKK